MNELTKKLAGQALDKAVPYTWTTLNYEQIQELLACHTEMVVKECTNFLKDGLDDHFAAEQLEEHFGVEE